MVTVGFAFLLAISDSNAAVSSSFPALAGDRPVTHTNWVENTVTNLIEMRMSRNRFINEYRTNWAEHVTTNVFETKSNNVALIPGVNNNSNFVFRIVAEFESSAIGTTNTNYVTSSVLFQGNDYWPSGGSFLINWGGVTYTSLSAWRTATGQEKSGLLATGLATNPMLAAPATSSARPSSPATPASPSSPPRTRS